MIKRFTLALTLAFTGCVNDLDDTDGSDFVEPEDTRDNVDQQGIIDCTERRDVGYRSGDRFSIDVVSVDARPVEVNTANAYVVMQQAAARDHVSLRIISGFRTMAEQQYLYHCYLTGSCNNGNLAARPGYSNHQSGHALDLNTSESGVYSWLANHGAHYGFRRTVASEIWHWEWWGGGPGGGPCGAGAEKFGFDVLDGDFDGDGKSDLATISQDAGGSWRDGVDVELARDGAFGAHLWNAELPARMKNGGDKDYRVLTGDVDGDGKSDLIALSPNAGGAFPDEIAVEISKGDRFASAAWDADLPGRMRSGGAGNTYQVRVADFDGDGKDDVAALSKDADGSWSDWIAIERSTGHGFDSRVWAAETPQRMRNGGAGHRYFTLVGDFDGDGAKDFATVSPDAGGSWDAWIAMELSTGNGFTSTTWNAELPQRMRNGGGDSDYRVLAIDVNADGKSDIVALSPDAGGNWSDFIAVEISTGTGFTSATWSSALPAKMREGGRNAEYQVKNGDFDGDGAQDLSVISPDGDGWGASIRVELSRANQAKFASVAWACDTPQWMRNGGKSSRYVVRAGDFNGDGRTDLASVSPDADGIWKTLAVVTTSSGDGFHAHKWEARLPERMRDTD